MILALETSGPRCMVAVGEPEAAKTLAVVASESPQAHSERLFQMIESSLGEAGCTRRQLTAVAVSMGPGSFTGLRIGLSAAKGLCFALDIPLVGVPTPDVVAAGIKLDGRFRVVSTSRRQEYYDALFDGNQRIGEIDVLTESELVERLETGDGLVCFNARDILTRLPDNLRSSIRVVDGEAAMPDVSQLMILAARKLRAGLVEDLANVVPLYVQGFRGKVPA